MRRTTALCLTACLLVLASCAPQDVAVSSGKARFASYPDTLLAAFETACTGPAQQFSRIDDDLVECREYLPPEPTAALILGYNGTTEDLPQLVIRFRTIANATGYLVENDVFVNVPQKSGDPIHVYQKDSRTLRRLDQLYLRAGGIPE